MRKKIKHFSLSFLRKSLEKLPSLGKLFVPVVAILAIPFALLWKLLRPIVVQLYKFWILIRQKTNRYFHAQHKVLAVVGHKYTVHLFVGALAFGIVTVNIAQAQEVRAEQFITGSVIDTIINPNAEQTINTEFGKRASTTYIDTSATVRASNALDTTVDLTGANDAVLAQASGSTSGALSARGSIDPSGSTVRNAQVTQYTVGAGETISTIAEKFGISTQTIMIANNLTDDAAKRVKTGDQIYILPTSGVAHTVRSGQTAESIAKEYGAKAEDIIAFNKLITSADLESGTEIIVPGGTREVTPPPAAPSAPTQVAATRFGGINRTASIAPAPSQAAPVAAAAAPASSGGKFQWPTTTRRISQYFGYRHTGLDIDGEFGDPIYAASGGRVTTAGWGGAYGNMVMIDHGGGVVTRYAHLQRIYVSAGQNVGKGAALGEEGSTGRSTGSHLHYEVIVNGRFVNPFGYH